MTEHSIEELKRQRDAARSRADAAHTAYVHARVALREALEAKLIADHAAKGIHVGDKVRVVIRPYSRSWESEEARSKRPLKTEEAFFAGVGGRHFGSDDILERVLFAVKKDGTRSQRAFRPLGDIVDVQPLPKPTTPEET